MQVFLGKNDYISYSVESTRGTFNSSLKALPVYNLKLLSLDDSYIRGGYIDSSPEPIAASNLYTGTLGTFEFYMPLLASDDASLVSSYHTTYYDMLKAIGFELHEYATSGHYDLGWPIDYCLSFRLRYGYFQLDFKGCSVQSAVFSYKSTGLMLIHVVVKGILHFKGRVTSNNLTNFDCASYSTVLPPAEVEFNGIPLAANSVKFTVTHKLNVASTDLNTGKPTFTYIKNRSTTSLCKMYNTAIDLDLNTIMGYLEGNTDVDVRVIKPYANNILSYTGRVTSAQVATDSVLTIASHLIVTDKKAIELKTKMY